MSILQRVPIASPVYSPILNSDFINWSMVLSSILFIRYIDCGRKTDCQCGNV